MHLEEWKEFLNFAEQNNLWQEPFGEVCDLWLKQKANNTSVSSNL